MLESALATVYDLKVQGVDPGGEIAEALIAFASDLIVQHCDREFLFASRTEFPALDGDRRSWSIVGPNLRLKTRPLVSVSSVSVCNVDQTVKTVDETTQLPLSLEPETVWLHDEGKARGRLYRANGWPHGQVRVTYSAGYKGPNQGDEVTAPELPATIKQACISICANLNSLIERGMDIELISERTVAGYALKWSDGSGRAYSLIPNAAKLILRRHKRVWIR